MPLGHHDLAHEFPEFKERIHELKMNDAHFKKLFEEYDQVTTKIEALEKQESPVADETMEDLKKQRLALKDSLYGMLKG
ncbi:YdcH family protein [Thiomicrospira sp.]|uniref:YdcH family protein n=1 Tax=Thiomicrospira sp. TaxID=935 RepID=UPI002F93AA89